MTSNLSNIKEVINEGYEKITLDEKIIIARETNRIRLPRELAKWLQSLDLSYKVKNLSRDLSNGFSIAEILSRYPVPFATNLPYDVTNYYRVNMQEFSNGISFSERATNWNHIKKILKDKYHMQYPEDLPDKVQNQAPNAALDFLIILYKFLTRKNINITNKIDETEKYKNYNEFQLLPSYMRPTTNLLIRDNETQRIKDDVVRKFKVENIIQNYNKFLASERENQKNMEQFNKGRKIKLKKIDPSSIGSKLIGSSPEKNQNMQSNEVNEIRNESNNNNLSNDNLKEERVNLLGILNQLSEENREQENIENEFKLIIRKNFVESDKNIEMDLKNYSSDKDLLEYFFEKISLCSPENIEKIFSAYEDKEKEFIGIISRTLIELDPFIRIMVKLFEAFYKNNIPWIKFKTVTLNICKSVHDITKEKCDNIFLNFCLNYTLEMIEKNPLYRNEMCQIIFALTSNTSETHINLLRRISKKLCSSNEIIFYHILIQCMNNIKDTDEIMTPEILIFYNDAIIKGISSSDDIIIIKSIYLIIQLLRFDYFYCLRYHQDIFKHKNSSNWEILSLILIYCSKMLDLYNRQKLMTEQNFFQGEGNVEGEFGGEINLNKEEIDSLNKSNKSKINQKEEEKEGDKSIKSIKEEKQEAKNENQEDKNNINNNSKLESIDKIEDIQKDPNDENDANKLENVVKDKIKEIQKCEGTILEIIDYIFNLSSPRMTIKIGFIYLAEILEIYPDLAKKYMKLLIEYKDSTIRKEVLKVNKSTEEYEYTMNCYTERYKICGTPYFWNQLVIAGIFRDYVIENLERFESTHLLILHSIIIHQDFNEEESNNWILLYNDLKKYLFVSLCEKQFSNVAFSILNKIFSFGKILKELLDSTFDLFISTMKIIYGDEIMDEPHENMKTLLTFISELKSGDNDCKGYIYKLIKTFAIQYDKKYLKSNLLPLMNSISNEKRGNIFNEE